jgi:hypothetical protein
MKKKNRILFIRIGFGAIGIGFICAGATTLATGNIYYPNYWHAPVFAPLAILSGIVILFLVRKIVKRNKAV